ncbi:hypothetical protein CEXT_83671 [Caerostris extrusa]|uniref:Uncharacterized protein n=1 Tax=Caerostris extrusa TaxID=172846 RepID=A0AAV4RCC8_CAEEX|nr:hypothetical protein CEXT_83671 [Caerostris extrusa]
MNSAVLLSSDVDHLRRSSAPPWHSKSVAGKEHDGTTDRNHWGEFPSHIATADLSIAFVLLVTRQPARDDFLMFNI